MKTKINQAKKEIKSLELKVQEIKVLKIKNDEELKTASNYLTQLNNLKKEITAKKETITKPLNEALKNIRNLFYPLEKKVNDLVLELKNKIAEYEEEKRKLIEKEKKELAEKVEKGELKMEHALSVLEQSQTTNGSIKTDDGKVFFRMVKEVVIEDESLIPREYLVPNMVKIRSDALNGKNIPGVKVIEKKQVVVSQY
jgi:chromosome segregation ATPase